MAYRPREVAEKLGVSERYVYLLMDKGDLRPVILAGRQMILSEDIGHFIEQLKADRDALAQGSAA